MGEVVELSRWILCRILEQQNEDLSSAMGRGVEIIVDPEKVLCQLDGGFKEPRLEQNGTRVLFGLDDPI